MRLKPASTCAVCEKTFRRDDQRPSKYCGAACRQKADQRKTVGLSGDRALSGPMAEHLVIADILRQGWHAYPSAQQHAPFDIAAHKDGLIVRVEVKSGRIHIERGTRCFPKPPTRHRLSYDILAIVYADRIDYWHRTEVDVRAWKTEQPHTTLEEAL